MNNGYFMLQRRFFSHWLWNEDRTLSKAEAFLDLLQLAAFAPTKRIVSKEVVLVPRGGIAATERFLSGRWKWSRTKVRHFLGMLESQKMIRCEKNHEKTVFLLCNFDKWNPQKDQGETKEEPRKDPIEEDKERKEGRVAPARAEDSVLPDEKEALVTAINSGVDKSFASEAWLDYSSRNGKDGAGVVVKWMSYVRKRWTREQVEWKNGTHRSRKVNGHNGKPHPEWM